MWRNIFHLPDYHRLWFRFPADSTIGSCSHALPLGGERFVHNLICATAQARHHLSAVKLASNSVLVTCKKGLDSSAFARRYLRNRADILFRAISCETVRNKKSAVHFSLFLWVLRCFTSPGSFHTTYVFSRGYPDFIGMGFPIRTFPDQRLLATSPRLIAGCHVLHQLFHAKPSTVRPYVLRPSGNTIRMRGSCTARSPREDIGRGTAVKVYCAYADSRSAPRCRIVRFGVGAI